MRFLCTEILERSIAPFKNKEKKSGQCRSVIVKIQSCEMFCIDFKVHYNHCRVHSSIGTKMKNVIATMCVGGLGIRF